MDITELKAGIESWAADRASAVGDEWHRAVADLAEYLEGQNKINDAIALLQSSGYTVTKA